MVQSEWVNSLGGSAGNKKNRADVGVQFEDQAVPEGERFVRLREVGRPAGSLGVLGAMDR